MGMEDHKLKVFCTVAETKSFSKTSEIIHLTQPAVSLQIQALEEIYESKLFDRTSNSINLTPSGEILYRYAKDILKLYAEAEKEIGKITGLIKGCVLIGGSTTIGNYVLPNVVVAFKDKHPKIKINLLIANTKKVEDFVTVGAIDFGLVEGIPTRQKITIDRFIDDELIVIVPPHHQWAKKKTISIAEITKEPFIIREEGSGTRFFIESFLKEQGMQLSDLKIVMSLGGIESIKLAVETGSGVSIISKWAARKEIKYGTLKGIYFKEAPMRRSFSLILPKNAIINHAVDEFLNFLKSYNYDDLI